MLVDHKQNYKQNSLLLILDLLQGLQTEKVAGDFQ